MKIIMKGIKYICCVFSFAMTVLILSQAILKPPEGYSLFESVVFLGALIFGLVLLGGFFIMIADRKQLQYNPVKMWLYVIFVPIVSWVDILLQPEPDGSSRIKHVFKDVYKFVMYLWGYKSRAVSFVITIAFLFFLPFDSSDIPSNIKFTFPLIYAVFLFAIGIHFFKIADRKRFFILNSKMLTGLYIFFVPVVSWKEILLAPEPDGSRVKSVVYDSAAFMWILAKYVAMVIVLFFIGCLVTLPFFSDAEGGVTMNELVMWEVGLLAVLVVLGSPFVYIARRKKLYTSMMLLWLYVIFVPIVSWIDIVLSRSKKNEAMTTSS